MSVRSCIVVCSLLAAASGLLPSLASAQTAYPFPASTGGNPSTACAGTVPLSTYGAVVAPTGAANPLYDVGCSVGVATFYHFSATGARYDTGGNLLGTFDASSAIFFTPGAGGQPTIVFSSPTLFSIAPGSGSLDIAIEYYIDPPIDILGLGLADAPFQNASIFADVCIDNTFDVNCPVTEGRIAAVQAAAAQRNEYTTFIDPNMQNNFVPFDRATEFADVQLYIDLQSTQTDGASIPSFGQSALLAIPEPGEIPLLGLGLAMLVGVTRRSRRAEPFTA